MMKKIRSGYLLVEVDEKKHAKKKKQNNKNEKPSTIWSVTFNYMKNLTSQRELAEAGSYP